MKRTLLLSILLTVAVTLSSVFLPLPRESALEVASFNASPLSRCTFFGDSTTYGLIRYNAHNDGRFGKNYYTLQDSQIWVPKDGTFYLGNVLKASAFIGGKSYTLAEACRAFSPEKLILTVGINGLANWEETSFLRYYKKLIDTVREASPNTELYLQSVYPIAPKAKEKLPEFSNEKIQLVNSWICSLARKEHLCYLNAASALTDTDGNLKESYHNGDGLHLSCQGFNEMLKYVENELMKGDI